MTERKIGPNMKKLIAQFAAAYTVKTYGSSLGDSLAAFATKERIIETTGIALHLADEAINAMRQATGKFYSDDEEEIAGIILTELKKRNES